MRRGKAAWKIEARKRVSEGIEKKSPARPAPAAQRSPDASFPSTLLDMSRSAGNQAVVQLLSERGLLRAPEPAGGSALLDRPQTGSPKGKPPAAGRQPPPPPPPLAAPKPPPPASKQPAPLPGERPLTTKPPTPKAQPPAGQRAPGQAPPGQQPAPAPQVNQKPPTKADSSSGVDWDQVILVSRAVTEIGRLYPVYGIFSGIAADGLQTLADFKTIQNENAPVFETFLAVRNGVNLINNALGHILYVDQLVQDGLLASAALAPFASITATINTVGKEIKVTLDGVQLLLDIGLTAGAEYNRQKAAPGSKSEEAWKSMANGYAANILGTGFTTVLDAVDLASAGAAQGGAISTAAQAGRRAIPVLKVMKPVAISLLQSWVNLWGGDVVAKTREVGPGGVAKGIAFGVIVKELAQMKSMYQAGDVALDVLVAGFTQQKGQAELVLKQLLGGRDPFTFFRDASVQALNDMRDRVGQVAEMGVFATTAKDKADWVRGKCDAALGTINSLQVPNVQLPKADLGEGVLAEIGEAVIGAGTDLANQGLEVLVGQIRSRVEEGKETLKAPVQTVKDHADEIGEFMQIMARMAQEQVVFMRKWIDDVSKKLARCKNVEDVMNVLINQALSIAGVEGEFQLQDLRDGWRDLGPMIDKAIVWAEGQRKSALGITDDGPKSGPFAAPLGVPPEPPGGPSKVPAQGGPVPIPLPNTP